MLPCQTQSETRTPPAINVMNPLLYLQQMKLTAIRLAATQAVVTAD
jgi:hypothetical protein